MADKRGPLVACAALLAALAIAAGAFGAHNAPSEQAASWLRTGSSYLLIHAIAAISLSSTDRTRNRSAWTMLVGALLFALTLYAMALGAPRWLGAVTPIGGALMIGAWLWVARQALKKK